MPRSEPLFPTPDDLRRVFSRNEAIRDFFEQLGDVFRPRGGKRARQWYGQPKATQRGGKEDEKSGSADGYQGRQGTRPRGVLRKEYRTGFSSDISLRGTIDAGEISFVFSRSGFKEWAPRAGYPFHPPEHRLG